MLRQLDKCVRQSNTKSARLPSDSSNIALPHSKASLITSSGRLPHIFSHLYLMAVCCENIRALPFKFIATTCLCINRKENLLCLREQTLCCRIVEKTSQFQFVKNEFFIVFAPTCAMVQLWIWSSCFLRTTFQTLHSISFYCSVCEKQRN